MTELEVRINLDKIVFDDKNQERKSWSCLGQTCSRSLIVFLFQVFVILLIIFGCFWGSHLSKTCDESTVWVGILCSAAGYILSSPVYEQVNFYKDSSLYFIAWSFRNWTIAVYSQSAKNWSISTKI